MKIGIDARSIHLEGAGRYIYELITNLANIDNHNEYIIYFFSKRQEEFHRINKQNFSSTVLPVSIFDIHKQPLLTYRLKKDRLDLFHATDHWLSPFFSPCDMVITIHDLNVYSLPKFVSKKALLYGRILFPLAFSKATKLILTSHFMKSQLLKYDKKLGDKISLVPLGVSDFFRSIDDSRVVKVKEKYNIKKDFILYVGTLRNYKNVDRLVEAFSMLPRRLRNDYDLIIAARKEHTYSKIIERVRELAIDESVRFLGFVRTDDLAGLYKSATVLVLPSFCEWFGLPIIEAMACGTPVITSNKTSMPEVAGGAAMLINPYDINELKDAIERIIRDEPLRLELAIKGKERANLFVWHRNVVKVLDIYNAMNMQGGR